MKKQLTSRLEERMEQFVGRKQTNEEKIERKKASMEKRKAEIVKIMSSGKITKKEADNEREDVYYHVHLKYLIKQSGHLYIEEEVEQRKASFYRGGMYEDVELPILYQGKPIDILVDKIDEENRAGFTYDRLKAVQYAERWWNDYNPAYKKFDVDCTNFISQCLHAGNAPMRGYPNRAKGWWYQNKNWSFSWSVANGLKVFLQTSRTGLMAKEVTDPLELKLGDVICYDFQGDGRFDHNTIVTAKDAAGMPLVNAHTYNSRMRFWAYEDSTAYTPNIKYKMFSIVDGT